MFIGTGKCIFLFSSHSVSSFPNSSKISSGVVEAKSFTTSHQAYHPCQTTHHSSWVLRLCQEPTQGAQRQPHLQGRCFSGYTSRLQLSNLSQHFVWAKFGMDGYGDTTFRINYHRSKGSIGLSGSLLWFLPIRYLGAKRKINRGPSAQSCPKCISPQSLVKHYSTPKEFLFPHYCQSWFNNDSVKWFCSP
jgi:hypothetical protein